MSADVRSMAMHLEEATKERDSRELLNSTSVVVPLSSFVTVIYIYIYIQHAYSCTVHGEEDVSYEENCVRRIVVISFSTYIFTRNNCWSGKNIRRGSCEGNSDNL